MPLWFLSTLFEQEPVKAPHEQVPLLNNYLPSLPTVRGIGCRGNNSTWFVKYILPIQNPNRRGIRRTRFCADGAYTDGGERGRTALQRVEKLLQRHDHRQTRQRL